MVDRKVRWNRFTDTEDQVPLRYTYVVAILNEPREIERIKERFIGQMAPADEFYELCDVPIQNSGGLHCLVFSFLSGCGSILYPEKIYGNRDQFKKDRDLSGRDTASSISYVERLVA